MYRYNEVIEKVKSTLIKASTSYRNEHKNVIKHAIEKESLPRAKVILNTLIENANVAEENHTPLCDDTGIPHVLLEVGNNKAITGEFIEAIHEGIALGLKSLPGRPMAVLGDDRERLEQSMGLDSDPAGVVPAPITVKRIDEDLIRVYILMQGGGPEIRGKTYRVFHRHSLKVILDEVVSWAKEEAKLLGCLPCSPAIGIGRSHFEASTLMLEAMAKGRFDLQSDIEKEITKRINESSIGPLGLKGDTTALATFLKIGPQRASGVRIVSMRLCCCVEPRVASCELEVPSLE